jgi:hypothetical protein
VRSPAPANVVAGRAAARAAKASVPGLAGVLSASAPPGARYHDRAVVPGAGKRLNERSNAATGAPGVALPAPLSKRTLTDGCASNAASAAA